MKKTLILVALLVAVLGFGQMAFAVPFMDTGFAGVTAGDPDLVIAREQYKWIAAENTWRQAIYFRFNDGDSDVNTMSGKITFDPNSLTFSGVETSAAAMAASDVTWGITGAPYNVGVSRGFENAADTYTQYFNEFTFYITHGVDDFRIYVDYGVDFPVDGSFMSIELEGEHELGIQVGDANSGVPYAGIYADDYGIASDGDQHVKIGLTPVPEPLTMLLFGPALLGLVGLKRRKA